MAGILQQVCPPSTTIFTIITITINRFGGQDQGMVGNPASLLLAHQQLREAANQASHLETLKIPEIQ